MEELAKPALEAVNSGEIKFYPKDGPKHIIIGLKILKTGVYRDSFGGDIELNGIKMMKFNCG